MAKILLVEADAINAERLQLLLASEALEVDVCFDPDAALSLFSENVHDLLICNISMPGLSGYELCRRVKSSCREKNLPVILLSEPGDHIDIAQALRCEADYFVTQPYQREQFIARIRLALQRQSPDGHGEPLTGTQINFQGKTFTTGEQKARILELLLAAFDGYVTAHRQLDETKAELAIVQQSAAIAAHDLDDRGREKIAEQIERRELLYEARKMDALGELASGLAHDFNNLLTVVVGNLDTISAEIKGNLRVSTLCNAALDAALRGGELTRQLLAFSCKQPLTPRLSNVHETISTMVQALTPSLGKIVKLVIDEDPNMWPVLVDPAQLHVSISNLFKNAVEAMPNGGRLKLKTRNVTLNTRYTSTIVGMTPGEYCLITVSDTGGGISAQIMPRVFEPMFTTKTGKGSAGLGLSMVFGFVRQSGGYIKLESTEQKGTAVHMYLPRAKGGVATMPRAEMTDRPQSGNETILLVEDDINVRRTVIQQLHQLGYHVLEADHAAAAFAILDRTEKIDLLFTDIVMPGGISGRELGHKAALLRPGLKMLYTSGYLRGAREDHKLDAADIFIGKPFRLNELSQKIREALGHQSPKTVAQLVQSNLESNVG